MIYVIIAVICFAASAVGAAVGIGGGVIIKPVLDSFKIMDVTVISFLSGVTVLCMSTYTVIKGKISGETKINIPMAAAISAGAVVGGIVGKMIFSQVIYMFKDENVVGAAQSLCLFALTAITLTYSLFRKHIPKFKIRSFPVAALLGLILGVFSSFLGIGGGPINIMFLSVMFSFGVQTSRAYSLFIIMCSQISSVLWQIGKGSVPEFPMPLMLIMASCGIMGGVAGLRIKKCLKPAKINTLFNAVQMVIMCICIYNFINYNNLIR
ncbi:MAG: sulfite exporter TauE/SafE family protein [Candidatus Ornithomonoglobus sp.]